MLDTLAGCRTIKTMSWLRFEAEGSLPGADEMWDRFKNFNRVMREAQVNPPNESNRVYLEAVKDGLVSSIEMIFSRVVLGL